MINLATVYIKTICLGKTLRMPGFEPGVAGCEARTLTIVLLVFLPLSPSLSLLAALYISSSILSFPHYNAYNLPFNSSLSFLLSLSPVLSVYHYIISHRL